ncbi:methyltransferase domain-containing protein [Nocardioides sp.]|uniref:class I SAM-dependent methyltransferase n=1 Tax=Nocardioides sp. TaxID=35761 RepID=UPI0031FEC15B|nr:putative SAM-dependent methyltransferase [Nocardioides sp.]
MTEPPTLWQRIARSTVGDDYAATYADRFRKMAARGEDIHGEVTFVTRLVGPPARVLDAGCGTGRIAVRLHELGYDVVGVDVDQAMLDVARADNPAVDWRLADLATFDLADRFDVVLLAGNIVPLLEPGTLAEVCGRLAAHTTDSGIVVCGFGLDPAHLPGDCPVTPLADLEAAMAAAGLVETGRFGTWDSGPFVDDGGYVVTVHTRSGERQ